MYLDKIRVNIAMAKKGLNKKRLAAACGLSQQAITTMLKKQSCTPHTMYELTQALGVTVEYITKED